MSTPFNHLGDLDRLKRERAEADRAYNDALTVLDGVIQRVREPIAPPPDYDEFQVTSLNQQWELLTLKSAEGSRWVRWLREQVWAVVAPLFTRQQEFNSALVDHVNRNVSTHRETVRALADVLKAFREEHLRLVTFQSKLILYAQQVTPYVDTKDREVAGLMGGGVAGLSSLSDEVQKQWESTQCSLSVLNRATHTLKHALERIDDPASVRRNLEGEPSAADAADLEPGARVRAAAARAQLNSYKYVAFEDQFRGPQDEIRERLKVYAPIFRGANDVLDLGCGRGEFLDVLREAGVSAHGVDRNHEMADACRDRGLQATAGDALQYLSVQADESLGGLFAAQVAEHLEPDYLLQLLELGYRKLRPGSKIVLETINPACWYAFFSSYIRDVTHARPLHPETLQYFLAASGFQAVDIRYSTPVPESLKLQPIQWVTSAVDTGLAQQEPEDVLREAGAVINDNVGKLNGFLFTYMDYAAVGERR